MMMSPEKENARRQPGESAKQISRNDCTTISRAIEKLGYAYESKQFSKLQISDVLLLERHRILSHSTAFRLIKEVRNGQSQKH